MTKPELVLFDLGGVMVRLSGGVAGAAAKAGVTLPTLADDQWTALRSEYDAYERGEVGTDAYFAAAAARTGMSVDEHRRFHRGVLDAAFPGVHELVDGLTEAGAAVGCLSNTNAEHWAMMHDAALPVHLPLASMTHRFASFEIGRMKPSPAIYEHVERATGMSGGAIAFFDDKPENVAAAADRGWLARRVTDAEDPAAEVRGVLAGYGWLR